MRLLRFQVWCVLATALAESDVESDLDNSTKHPIFAIVFCSLLILGVVGGCAWQCGYCYQFSDTAYLAEPGKSVVPSLGQND